MMRSDASMHVTSIGVIGEWHNSTRSTSILRFLLLRVPQRNVSHVWRATKSGRRVLTIEGPPMALFLHLQGQLRALIERSVPTEIDKGSRNLHSLLPLLRSL